MSTPRTWYTEQELKCNSISLLISQQRSIEGIHFRRTPIERRVISWYFAIPHPCVITRCQVARILSIFCELHFGARLVISKISVTKLRLGKCDTSRLKTQALIHCEAENNATWKTLIWKCHSYVTRLQCLSPPTSVNAISSAFIRHCSDKTAAFLCSHDVIVRAANKIIPDVCC